MHAEAQFADDTRHRVTPDGRGLHHVTGTQGLAEETSRIVNRAKSTARPLVIATRVSMSVKPLSPRRRGVTLRVGGRRSVEAIIPPSTPEPVFFFLFGFGGF